MLCAEAKDSDWIPLDSHHIIATVWDKSNTLKFNLQAIGLDLVGAHSLRAGGDMALNLHGYDDTT